MSDVVVVTGASAGIGRAAAVEFARRGARVALLARASDHLDDAVREVGEHGPAIALEADVADPGQVEAAAAEVERRWGCIDVWVNNAMTTVYAPAEEIAADDLRRVTDVCYHGAVWGTRAALKRMHRRGRGSIVQVGSALAYRSIPLQAAYCGAKSALRAFTDALRSELAHRNSPVRLTMVHLAAFNTPQFDWGRSTLSGRPRPVGRIFQPEIAADAIVTAAGGSRREWWVGFPVWQSILGQWLIPGLLDRHLGEQAWEGQHGEDGAGPRADNLYHSAKLSRGAHGRFDDEAASTSVGWWLSKHRGLVLVVAGTLAAGAAAVALRAHAGPPPRLLRR